MHSTWTQDASYKLCIQLSSSIHWCLLKREFALRTHHILCFCELWRISAETWSVNSCTQYWGQSCQTISAHTEHLSVKILITSAVVWVVARLSINSHQVVSQLAFSIGLKQAIWRPMTNLETSNYIIRAWKHSTSKQRQFFTNSCCHASLALTVSWSHLDNSNQM